MWTSATQLVTALVSVASLAWVVTTQVRSSSARKHADRAETAVRLLAALEVIGVGGIDSRLADSRSSRIHADQIRRLQEIIRVNTAEFERRARRVGFPLAFHFVIGLYGVLFLIATLGTLEGIASMRADQQWAGVLTYLGFVLLFVGMIMDFVLAAYRWVVTRAVRRNAGMYLPSVFETVRTSYAGFLLWRMGRRANMGTEDSELPGAVDAQKIGAAEV